MADTSNDPRHQRFFQTRDGVTAIPRDQQGVKLAEYFKNAELPEQLDQAVVYATSKGPVVATPDPEEWSARHDEMAQGYADRLKTQIDERGYYAKSLGQFAGRLAETTGRSQDEMKALISQRFTQTHGKDPYAYLNDLRVSQGKPVRQTEPRQEASHDMDR